MGAQARARHWVSWLILLAFLNAMAVPVWAQANGSHESARTMLMQVCSADGTQTVQVDLAGDEADGHQGAHDGFCVLCFYSATAPNCSPADPWLTVTPSVPSFTLDEIEPVATLVWSPSLARAPPSGI